MRRPAKILLAGAVLLAPMTPPLSAVAISQSTVVNNQVQLDDVFATQTLNVVDVSDGLSAVGTATGNGVTSAVVLGSLDVESSQTVNPAADATGPVNINAHTSLNIANDVVGQTVMQTNATANTSEADSLGGGALTGNFVQVAAGTVVTADNDFNAPTAYSGGLSANAQALANSLSFGLDGGSSAVTTSQSNSGTVSATTASDSQEVALLDETPGTAAFSAIAVANNITATGTDGANQLLTSSQTTTGATVLAGTLAYVNDGQTVQGDASATANNISASGDSGDLNITSQQTNGSYTQAQAIMGAYEYGSGQATASGVGNALMAANAGPTTEIYSNQTNNADVEATANFTGGNGQALPAYDSVVSATAIGNTATGFACSECGGVITVNNGQTNTNGVGAEAITNLTGTNRSVSSVATAVGNNATFYVSKPAG